MGIGFHFDDIEREFFEITEKDIEEETLEDTPIDGFHDLDYEYEYDSTPIGGMHGEFRERE